VAALCSGRCCRTYDAQARAIAWRQKANDGRTLVAVDFSDIRHKPVAVVRRADLEILRARVAELEELVRRVEAIAAWHRADYERERERAEQLAAEIVRMFADLAVGGCPLDPRCTATSVRLSHPVIFPGETESGATSLVLLCPQLRHIVA
jgi:hypothetical protein